MLTLIGTIVLGVLSGAAGGLASQWLALRKPVRPDYRAAIELHRIRRQFEVAQLRFELRRDGADARRLLRVELRALDEPDGLPRGHLDAVIDAHRQGGEP